MICISCNFGCISDGIVHKKNQAFYHAEEDYINMRKPKSFINHESYYGTLFHQLIHSTGHKERLDRKELNQMAEFGSEPYSIEELTAEIGSCYLFFGWNCKHLFSPLLLFFTNSICRYNVFFYSYFDF